MGSQEVVLPNAIVSDCAVIGHGSVVLLKVPMRSTVMRVPAKQITGFDK
jgi:serine acetyltransferase